MKKRYLSGRTYVLIFFLLIGLPMNLMAFFIFKDSFFMLIPIGYLAFNFTVILFSYKVWVFEQCIIGVSYFQQKIKIDVLEIEKVGVSLSFFIYIKMQNGKKYFFIRKPYEILNDSFGKEKYRDLKFILDCRDRIKYSELTQNKLN